MGLIFGKGLYSKGKYPTSVDGKVIKEYQVWMGMLHRCYGESFRIKQPTYAECSVSENFRNFQFFAEWCNNQIGFRNKGWPLDKDTLIKGNKVYSENTCVFVPREINNVLTNRRNCRGEHLIGVNFHKPTRKFRAAINKDGVKIHLGLFSTPEEAFKVYKQAKECHVKQLAERYKDYIDIRAYSALITWEVDLDD